jgi:hypothetical protein
MPLTLIPPRKGRSSFWRIRGTVRGKYIDETTGVESRQLAEAIRIQREGEILNETIFGARAASRPFSDAAVSYLETAQPGPAMIAAIKPSVASQLTVPINSSIMRQASPAVSDRA